MGWWLVAMAFSSTGETAETGDTGFEVLGPPLRSWFDPGPPPPARIEAPRPPKGPVRVVEGGTVDVVLLIDRSCSMYGAGQRGTAMEVDAWAWALQHRPGDRLAMVGVTDVPEVLVPLTEASAIDPDALAASIGSMPVGRRGNLGPGLVRARELLSASDAEERLVVVICDGFGAGSLEPEADVAWAEGIHVVVVGYGAVVRSKLQPIGRGVGWTPHWDVWYEQFGPRTPDRPARVLAALDQEMLP